MLNVMYCWSSLESSSYNHSPITIKALLLLSWLTYCFRFSFRNHRLHTHEGENRRGGTEKKKEQESRDWLIYSHSDGYLTSLQVTTILSNPFLNHLWPFILGKSLQCDEKPSHHFRLNCQKGLSWRCDVLSDFLMEPNQYSILKGGGDWY